MDSIYNKQMIVLLFTLTSALMVEQCEVINKGLVLSKYYKEWCPSCQKLGPVINEIESILLKNGVDLIIRNVDCEKCDCDGMAIASYPTMILTRDGVEVSKMAGYKDFDGLVNFITANSSIPSEIFADRVASIEGKVHSLTKKEMLRGLDGPWIVLFYSQENEKYLYLFKEIAKLYGNKVNIGTIGHNEANDLISRYNIVSYPLVLALYDGIMMPYGGKPELPELIDFVDELIEPAFQDLKLADFKAKAKNLVPGEPIYVVFHKSIGVASHYFQQQAHLYRFRAKIFKTSDQEFFEYAGIYPRDPDELVGNTHPKHSDMVILSVYKNGMFYPSTVPLENVQQVADWIFHSHFPNVTQVTNKNFYTVFHGLKPAALLLTKNEKLVAEFNKVSANRHLGAPFDDFVFAVLDLNEYPLFIPTLLPKIPYPSVVIFEPSRNLFFYKKEKLSEENFVALTLKHLHLYNENKLPLYPQMPSHTMMWIGLVGMAIAIISYISIRKPLAKRD